MSDDESERLLFDVELERLPAWVHASSAAVVLVGALVAAHVVHMLFVLPFLVASAVGRRFTSSAVHVEVDAGELDLGKRHIPRSEVLDVWADGDDAADPRVTVAFGSDVELAILHFADPDQARRFADALAGAEGPARALVAGYAPRLIDTLSSLRFVALAAAFFATGARYGLFLLGFFALGAWALVRARQIVAKADRFELRTLFGVTSHPYANVEGVDVEAGIVRFKDGTELEVPLGALRDPTLASPAWV
ncbi:MAG TPA: hypothetical protein VM925_09455, partial [Labilithrix sp.]|nr:hypothetical protein [Labilithrix sp.]